MSGSPKYSTVSVASAYARREAQRRAQREAERRSRQEQRARERAELAARRARERAARRDRARADVERRQREAADRRAAEQEAHASRVREEQAAADSRRLDEVNDLLVRVRTVEPDAPAAELAAIEQRLIQLRGEVGSGEPLGGAVEELRGRLVLLSSRGDAPQPDAGYDAVLARFEQQLAAVGPDGALHDPEGRRHCTELLDRLRAAAGSGAATRFAALLGTVEHALTRHAGTAQRHADQERLRAAEERRRSEEHAAARAAADQVAEEAAEAAEAAQAEEAEDAEDAEEAGDAEEMAVHERRAAALVEAADRLGVVRTSAEAVAAEARELADPDLAVRVERALHTVTGALGAQAAEDALEAVGALERLLPEAEARLDELQLAFTRRSDLAEALQDAMCGEGFTFTEGSEQGAAFVLRFERPSGARYETTVATEADGTPVLVYHVEGEPDVTLHPAAEGAVCDRTEDLLERVHEAMGERDGFLPGELTWQGKPPRGQAGPLPGAGRGRRG
ncbi:hypothetical protein [Streptomyces sp. AA1529]|uniref:hypothetical protein n=1 Tax=Streptomyces sp. AA1529 TaxID=1203257 RepID=UPI003D710B80